LFNGRMPYRDFLLLHPPGIPLALQPFAALGAVTGDPLAMESARVAFMLLGAGSSLLIHRILLPHQLGRPRSPQPLVTRLVDVLGLRFLPPSEATVPAAILGAFSLVALVVALRTRLGELAVLVTLTNTVVLLLGPTWFIHYPAFVAAPLCLVYGAAMGELAGMRRSRRVRVIAGVMAAAAVSLLGSSMLEAQEGTAFPDQLLRGVLAARPGCVTTDNPTTLIFSNTLRRNLSEACPLVVDLSGYIYDNGNGHRPT
jgi:alpha-1,2-mannosyltransferase